jgi:hypothetical protein
MYDFLEMDQPAGALAWLVALFGYYVGRPLTHLSRVAIL